MLVEQPSQEWGLQTLGPLGPFQERQEVENNSHGNTVALFALPLQWRSHWRHRCTGGWDSRPLAPVRCLPQTVPESLCCHRQTQRKGKERPAFLKDVLEIVKIANLLVSALRSTPFQYSVWWDGKDAGSTPASDQVMPLSQGQCVWGPVVGRGHCFFPGASCSRGEKSLPPNWFYRRGYLEDIFLKMNLKIFLNCHFKGNNWGYFWPMMNKIWAFKWKSEFWKTRLCH